MFRPCYVARRIGSNRMAGMRRRSQMSRQHVGDEIR